MYYPIIDKLREIMTDITSVKEKEPLVIEGTITSKSGGTWTGSYSDITSAFSNNRQVLFKIINQDFTGIIPVCSYNASFSNSVYVPLYVDENDVIAYGTINENNTFALHMHFI